MRSEDERHETAKARKAHFRPQHKYRYVDLDGTFLFSKHKSAEHKTVGFGMDYIAASKTHSVSPTVQDKTWLWIKYSEYLNLNIWMSSV